MSKRLVIDCGELWGQACQTPHGLRAVQMWLRTNGIDPADVPVRSELVIADSAFGLLIHYEAYLTTDDGKKYVDPNDPDRAASENRAVPLVLAPPAHWPAATGGER